MITSCRKASELASRSLDEKLSRLDKARMCIHHVLCLFCSQFDKQIKYISGLFKSQQVLEETGDPMKPEAKERIRQAVAEKQATSAAHETQNPCC